MWVDESGCQRKEGTCKFGYALRGPTPVRERILVCGKHISTIAAMDVNALEQALGAVDADNFFFVPRGTLLPNLLPFDGCNPRLIVIVDRLIVIEDNLVSIMFT